MQFTPLRSSTGFLLLQVDTREAVSELLSLEGKIDLVIPRGGNELVKSVMEQVEGRVPVLGHTEGICHVYIHADADVKRAIEIGNILSS